jgi:hypothetical protein
LRNDFKTKIYLECLNIFILWLSPNYNWKQKNIKYE